MNFNRDFDAEDFDPQEDLPVVISQHNPQAGPGEVETDRVALSWDDARRLREWLHEMLYLAGEEED